MNGMTSAGIWDEAMRRAMELARESHAPFGAVVCRISNPDTVLCEGRNSSNHDPSGHAEINALRAMAMDTRLAPVELAVISTAEPCPMCAAACWWAGIGKIVYGTGISGLIEAGWRQIDLPARSVLAKATVGPVPQVIGPYRREWTDPLYAKRE